MNIVSLINTVAVAITGTPTFIHGDKGFQNLQDDINIESGVVFLDEPITSNDTLKKSGYLEESYPLRILFAKKSKMDYTPEQHQVLIQECREMRREFIVLLSDNENIRSIEPTMKTTDIINLFDINLSGVYLELTVLPNNNAANCFP